MKLTHFLINWSMNISNTFQSTGHPCKWAAVSMETIEEEQNQLQHNVTFKVWNWRPEHSWRTEDHTEPQSLQGLEKPGEPEQMQSEYNPVTAVPNPNQAHQLCYEVGNHCCRK